MWCGLVVLRCAQCINSFLFFSPLGGGGAQLVLKRKERTLLLLKKNFLLNGSQCVVQNDKKYP